MSSFDQYIPRMHPDFKPEPSAEPIRQFKGVWLCAAVLDDEALSPAEKILLAEIDSLTHPEKACYASNEFLAKRLHLSAPHMRDTLAGLTSNGYLIRLAFTGRVTLRCVHPTLSSNAQCVNRLIETHGIKLPPGNPPFKPGKQKKSPDTSYRENPTPKNSYRENPIAEDSPRENPTPEPVSEGKTRYQQSENSDTEKLSEESSIRETTTTEHAPATGELPITEEEVVVASSLKASFGQEAEMDAETLEDLGSEFGLNAKQADELRACTVRYGIGYVEEKAEITRAEPRKNAAAFFMKALGEDWKRPVKIARKPRNIPEPSKENDPPPAPPDFSAELRWWQSATEEQKEAMLARPEFELCRHRMRGNPTPGNLYLSAIRLALARQPEAAA